MSKFFRHFTCLTNYTTFLCRSYREKGMLFLFISPFYVLYLVAQRLKHLPAMWETWVRSLGGEILWRRKWQPTPVLFLPGKFHGQRSLVGYSPRGHKESDTTEWLHFHLYSSYREPTDEVYKKGSLMWTTTINILG